MTRHIHAGAYGASLNDILFAREGTPLLLFPVLPHVDFYYENLAAGLGLQPLIHISKLTSTQTGQYDLTGEALEEIGAALTHSILR